MAKVFPFRAYRYNKKKVKLENVITQPYDKINTDLQGEYYKKDSHNVVRMLLGKELKGDNDLCNKYTRAHCYFWHWVENDVMVRDGKPAFYAYHQEYKVEGKKVVRKGFIGLAEVEPFGGTVKAHEKTLDAPKADRLNLMKATHTTQGQIFMLYSDPKLTVNKVLEEQIAGKKPDMQLKDDYDETHKLWIVDDPAAIKKIQKAMNDQKLFIADGHHRYETGVNYYNFMKENGVEKIGNENIQNLMMTFVNIDEPGLTVLATHRLVHSLKDFNKDSFLKKMEKYFRIEEISFKGGEDKARKELFEKMDNKAETEHVFGVYFKGDKQFYLLELVDDNVMLKVIKGKQSDVFKKLDVSILHNLILENHLGIGDKQLKEQTNVKYVRYRDDAIDRVKKENFQIAFLLNPTLVKEVKDVAENNERMPQKSTDFYPKLLSGLTINRYNLDKDRDL
ncbi:MAG: DUF1015 domain-containing protein [Acidobacteria bacterium]|nr:DUF1015 domain-containing protein [Acidobacteriota bacterium]